MSSAPARAAGRLGALLAGFVPVGVFGILLLLAIGEWGLAAGVLFGSAIAAAAAWILVRLIARFVALRWLAATMTAIALVITVLSLF